MQIGGVKDWVGWTDTSDRPRNPPPAPPRPGERQGGRWNPGRVAAVEALWGAGFTSPGGAPETLRLARPLGLNPKATLLLIGGGMGGPAETIAETFGTWVESAEADPELAMIAERRRAEAVAGRKITVSTWDRDCPVFRKHSAHHALALESLKGAPFAPVLDSVADALRPHGQFVLTELVADGPTPDGDREFAAWCRLENRGPDMPSLNAITAGLARRRFDVRVVEDVSDRHVSATLSGWRMAVKAMAARPKPDATEAGIFVTEAELWLLRIRLMRRFGFRLLRWHAIGMA